MLSKIKFFIKKLSLSYKYPPYILILIQQMRIISHHQHCCHTFHHYHPCRPRRHCDLIQQHLLFIRIKQRDNCPQYMNTFIFKFPMWPF